jgi:hypothetical protein
MEERDVGFHGLVCKFFFPTVSHSVFPSKGQKKMLVEFGVDQDQDRLICSFFMLGAPGDSSCKRLGNLTLSTIPGQAQENLQKASQEEKAQFEAALKAGMGGDGLKHLEKGNVFQILHVSQIKMIRVLKNWIFLLLR